MIHYNTLITALFMVLAFTACSSPAPAALPEAISTATPLTAKFTALSTPVPVFTPTLPGASGCAESIGRVEKGEIAAPDIGKPLTYQVYLPPCYDPQKPGGYPLLVLLHGQGYPASHWIDLGAVNLSDHMIANGSAAPFIMLFPFEEYHLQPVTESPYGDTLIKNLLPALEKDYAVCNQRECRAIGGISRGAVWAARIALAHPDQFGSLGLHSITDYPYSTYKTGLLLRQAVSNGYALRIRADIGAEDGYRKNFNRFLLILDENNIPYESVNFTGKHEDAYWGSQMETYLRWYTAGWPVNR